MSITIYQGNDHVLPPSDINIVIDVIRAFTVAHYAFIHGVKYILLVGSVEDAFLLKSRYPHYILAGEINGLPIKGFDLDNSPKLFSQTNLAGKVIVQKTTNGVKATLNSLNTKQLFVTGFSNARTLASYIRELYHSNSTSLNINLIASHPTGDDDIACAEFIKSIILEGKGSASKTVSRIKQSGVAEKFHNPHNADFNQEDLNLCTTELNQSFIMRVNQRFKIPAIERINI